MAVRADDRVEIEKLEGSNDWWEWKYVVRLQLKAKRLWGHVDGTAALGAQPTAAEEEKFEHNAIRTQAILVGALSKKVTSLVLRCNYRFPFQFCPACFCYSLHLIS